MNLGIFGERDADSIAVIVNGAPALCYQDLDKLVDGLAQKLPKRELFFLVGSNDLPTLTCYLASLSCGAVPLLLGKGLPQQQLDRLIEVYNPRFIFISDDECWSQDGSHEEWRFGEYAFYSRDKGISQILHKDLAILLATSGSTGSPKLVRLSLRNIISNADSIIEYLNITSKERAITSLPFNYSYGLSVINSHLRAGAALVLTNSSIMDKKFWSQVRDYKVTSFAGVPYSYDILLRLRLGQIEMPFVKTLTQAGGRLEPHKMMQVHKICSERGINFFPMYGQTEATARIAFLDHKFVESKPGSIGKAIPGGQLWLEDDSGHRVNTPGMIGELIYAGANVSLGYAESSADLALGDLNQGILRTGDLARIDQDGYYFIEGRRNRFLKIFGIRVSLDSIEEIVKKKGWVCAAHGIDDMLVLFVVETPQFNPITFKAEMANILSIHPTAVKIYTLTELPRMNTGKVDYQCLNQML
jgi:long-chain acyl-CoA synthetase